MTHSGFHFMGIMPTYTTKPLPSKFWVPAAISMTLGAERVTHGCHASAQQCDCPSTMLWPFITQRSQWSQFTREDATNCQRYCWGIMARAWEGGAGRLAKILKSLHGHGTRQARMMPIPYWVSFHFLMLLSAAVLSNFEVRAMSLKHIKKIRKRRLSNEYWLLLDWLYWHILNDIVKSTKRPVMFTNVPERICHHLLSAFWMPTVLVAANYS